MVCGCRATPIPPRAPTLGTLDCSHLQSTPRPPFGLSLCSPHAPWPHPQGPLVSFHACHEATRVALGRKSSPCPSQAQHTRPAGTCQRGRLPPAGSLWPQPVTHLSLTSYLNLQPSPPEVGTDKETVIGKASLNTPQATVLTTTTFLLSHTDWGGRVSGRHMLPPLPTSQSGLLWVSQRSDNRKSRIKYPVTRWDCWHQGTNSD